MYYLIDICLAALFILSIIFAAKKGIFLVISDIAAAAVAVITAKIAGDKFAPIIYNKSIKNNVTVYLNGVFADSGFSAENVSSKISEAFGFLPQELRRTLFSDKGIDLTSIDYAKASTVEALESNIICPVVTALIRMLIYLTVFIVLVIIVRLIFGFIIKHMTPRPLKTVSSVLGAVFGAVRGTVYVGIAACILVAVSYAYEPMHEFVGDSVICGFIVNHLNISNLLS